GDEAAPGHAHAPAAGAVLDADEVLARLAVAQREAGAAGQLPSATDRGQEAEVSLLEDVAAVAIGQVELAALVGAAVSQAELGALELAVLRRPLAGHHRAPAARQAVVELADELGGATLRRRHVGQAHARLLDAVQLAHRRAPARLAGFGVEL